MARSIYARMVRVPFNTWRNRYNSETDRARTLGYITQEQVADLRNQVDRNYQVYLTLDRRLGLSYNLSILYQLRLLPAHLQNTYDVNHFNNLIILHMEAPDLQAQGAPPQPQDEQAQDLPPVNAAAPPIPGDGQQQQPPQPAILDGGGAAQNPGPPPIVVAPGPQPVQAQAVRNLKITDFLPKFQYEDGCDLNQIESFLQSYEDYCSLHNLNDIEKVRRFTYCLFGIAKLWYANEAFTNYEDLLHKFRKRFDPVYTQSGLLNQLNNLTFKPGSSLQDYLCNLQLLAQRLQLNEQQVLLYFQKGLPSQIRSLVSTHPDANLNQLIRIIRHYLEINSPEENTLGTGLVMSDLYQSIQEISDKIDHKSSAAAGTKQTHSSNVNSATSSPISPRRRVSFQSPVRKTTFSSADSRLRERSPVPNRDTFRYSRGTHPASRSRGTSFRGQHQSYADRDGGPSCYKCGSNSYYKYKGEQSNPTHRDNPGSQGRPRTPQRRFRPRGRINYNYGSYQVPQYPWFPQHSYPGGPYYPPPAPIYDYGFSANPPSHGQATQLSARGENHDQYCSNQGFQ